MPADITNVFVLLLENRSFDHMLGFSGISGDDAVTRQGTKVRGLDGSEFNVHKGARYVVGRPFHEPVTVDPGHEFLDVLEQLCGTQAEYSFGNAYPKARNGGFVSNFAHSHTRDEGDASGNFGQVMDGFTAGQLPVLNKLAQSFAVCDGWHASLPGPTFPNRLFAMGASSGGLDHSPTSLELITWEGLDGFALPKGSLFDALQRQFRESAWRIYSGDYFPLVCALKGIDTLDIRSLDDFHEDVGKTDYPWRLTWIEPSYGDSVFGTFKGGTSQHPMDCVASGERLLKDVYEAIRNSPHWESSLVIVTWDEHGGFYDHVPPGKVAAPGDTKPGSRYNQYGFDFKQLGVRVPAVVISPWIPAATIDHRAYDHSTIPRTIEDLFGLQPLTRRDGIANSLRTLLSLGAPRTDAPTALSPVATAGNPPAGRERPGNESVDNGPLPVFLHVAARHDLALSDGGKKLAILQRAQAVKTRAQARQYLDEIHERVNVAKSQRGP